MRSKLFVPGSRPEFFPKAFASEADGLSFDLEDAVAEDRKAEARELLSGMLRSDMAQTSRKTLIVRVNGADTPHFEADLAAVVVPGLDVINLPKPETVEDVRRVADAIALAERANGFTGNDAPVRLLLNIETPAALRRAAELATAHPRVAGLQLGLGDLFEPAGIHRRNTGAIANAMFAVRMAAAEGNVYAYDTVFANIRDADGFRAEAEMSRQLGFLGKSCIHPTQIALANDVYRPSDEELAHALRVIDAASRAETDGIGAYVVDGKMIDPPFVQRAQAIVETGRRLGLIPA
ncbi:HpcH/HpaI aldolase/citrate lyase family protein [Cupriavidus plantarum]|uniref:HpcH/HpaI aldolase/citrate lyase family protein n=1 Tax=Cupriavidus plantarum TaxID=942865 RepID=UPI001B2691B8|nr:CoA ester lyase [Cupriavidus plantarum]CAG2148204.1 Citrate lyase subunit beta [Cupriavidus plantarum]SMR85395.1 citrate lyase subunit beta / citryl-CoA lyase [Cupriavidus plantarum]